MTIYLSNGFRTHTLIEQKLQDKSAFKEIAEFPPQVFTGHLSKYKKDEAPYIISGYIEPTEEGHFIRNNDSLIRRDLIFIDYDDVALTEEAFKSTIQEKLADYNYILYPTISNGEAGKGVRYRLIIEPDRPLVEFEYKYVLKQVVDLIGIKIDESAYTWAQLQGLPAHRNTVTNYHVTVNRGMSFATPKRGEIPVPKKKEYKFNPESVTEGAIPHDEAIEMLKAYAEVDADNLNDINNSYNNSLSAIMVMAKAVMNGEIARETAIEGCKIIALGNMDWVEGNVSRLYRVLEEGVMPRTAYTFRSKFHHLFFREVETIDDLKRRLNEVGFERRESLKEAKLSSREVADILLELCSVVLIDEDDPELSKLAIYDPSEGIYKKGDRFINNLAMTVERTLSEHNCKDIKHFLTNDDGALEVERTQDSNLIVCNNGVYNRELKELLPFSSEWVFVNKIATDYVPNAPEPAYPDWKFSDWIDELSEGDDKKKLLLHQMFHSAINSNYVSEVAFFFYSKQGRTSKGTLQELLRGLVGTRNTSNLKIKEFENDFKLSTVYGKSLVLGDDNNPKDFNETSENFKSVITGDGVLLNGKFERPFNTKLTPLVIQSMNGIPRFADTTDGLIRRLRIIEFKKSYKAEDNNRKVKDIYVKDKQLHEYILAKVIDMQFDDVVETDESKELVKGIVLDNDPIAAFYEDVVSTLKSERLPTKFLFLLFKAWCLSENSPTRMKQRNFTGQIKDILLANGWEYSPKNLQPLQYWSKDDCNLLDSLDSENGNFGAPINYEIERYRQQGLFCKE